MPVKAVCYFERTAIRVKPSAGGQLAPGDEVLMSDHLVAINGIVYSAAYSDWRTSFSAKSGLIKFTIIIQ